MSVQEQITEILGKLTKVCDYNTDEGLQRAIEEAFEILDNALDGIARK